MVHSFQARKFAFVVACCASLFASHAWAGGFLVARFGGEHGHPTTDNPTAMYYNPAGLALGKGTRLYLDGNFAWRTFNFDRDPAAIDNVKPAGSTGSYTPTDGVPFNSGEATLTNIIASPMIAVATDFGVQGFGFGVGFYTPIGGTSVWDEGDASDDYPGAKDGSQRWWVIEGTIRSSYITAAAAYEIPETNLSIGVGFNTVLSVVHTIRARNVDGTDDLVNGNRLQEGRALVEVSGVDFSLGVGLTWQPMDNLWIGASWQSQPAFGEQKLEGDATIITGSTPFNGDKTKLELYQTLPDVYRLGARWRPNAVTEIRLFGDYQRWSVLEEQCFLNADDPNRSCATGQGKIAIIAREWNDTFGVRAGYSHWFTEAVEFVLGAGFDSNAVPDETIDPSLYDTNKFTASLGGRFELMTGLHLGAYYTQVIYLERSVDPRPNIADTNPNAGPDDRVSDISGTNIEERRRGPDAAGTYNTAVGVLNLNVEYAF